MDAGSYRLQTGSDVKNQHFAFVICIGIEWCRYLSFLLEPTNRRYGCASEALKGVNPLGANPVSGADCLSRHRLGTVHDNKYFEMERH
jgi:hypothetical protein